MKAMALDLMATFFPHAILAAAAAAEKVVPADDGRAGEERVGEVACGFVKGDGGAVWTFEFALWEEILGYMRLRVDNPTALCSTSLPNPRVPCRDTADFIEFDSEASGG